MEKVFSATARASATVANQPSFDRGGFPIVVRKLLIGSPPAWESLSDTVQLTLEFDTKTSPALSMSIDNTVAEGISALPTEPSKHTAGRAILAVLSVLSQRFPNRFRSCSVHLHVTKGISLRGTGLGSSGASPAAALKALFSVLENAHVNAVFSEEEIITVLRESDFGVPDNAIPAYFGGMNLLSEKARTQIPVPADFFFLLATPLDFGIETQKARAILKGLSAAKEEMSMINEALLALQTGDFKTYAQHITALHRWFVGEEIPSGGGEEIPSSGGRRSLRSSLYPGEGSLYTRAEEAANSAGALGLTISGAGPTLIIFLEKEADAQSVSQALFEAFAKEGQRLTVRLCQVDIQGATVIP